MSYGLPVILLLFLTGRVFGQDVYSLGAKVTLKASGQTADVVLRQLGRQSGYSFSFDADALKRIVVTGVDEENVPLGRVLRTLGSSYGLDFALIDKTISVRVAARAGAPAGLVPVEREGHGCGQRPASCGRGRDGQG